MTQTTHKNADLEQLEELSLYLISAAFILKKLAEQSDKNLRHVSYEDYEEENLANKVFYNAVHEIMSAEDLITEIINKRSAQND